MTPEGRAALFADLCDAWQQADTPERKKHAPEDARENLPEMIREDGAPEIAWLGDPKTDPTAAKIAAILEAGNVKSDAVAFEMIRKLTVTKGAPRACTLGLCD